MVRRVVAVSQYVIDQLQTHYVIPDEKISELVAQHFDLRPKGIVQMLDLLRPIYEKTAAYGHFGRTDIDAPWEVTDKAESLRKASATILSASDDAMSYCTPGSRSDAPRAPASGNMS